MPKVCGAGIPLRSLIKATSGNTMPFRNPFGLGHQQRSEEKKKTMVLHIDTEKMEALGLTDREMWLYVTLSIISSKKPWKGTDEELAEKCMNHISRVTVMRLKKSLIGKQLIMENEEGISLVQNEHEPVQNEHENVQNEQNGKEKEKNQKKIESVKIKSELKHARDFFSLFDFYKIAVVEYGYLHPKGLLEDMYRYYNANTWPQGWARGDYTDVWRNWLKNEKKIKGGRQPDLSEAVRDVMKTFLEGIDQQVIEPLMDVLEGVCMDAQRIKFYVEKGHAERFAKWLGQIEVNNLLAKYGKEVRVAAA